MVWDNHRQTDLKFTLHKFTCSERLDIKMENGQAVSDTRALTHNFCKQPDPNSQWLPASLILPLLPNQDYSEKGENAPQTNP